MEDGDTIVVVDEWEQVFRWRREQAIGLGCSDYQSELFADSNADLAELRRIVNDLGCDPNLAVRVLL